MIRRLLLLNAVAILGVILFHSAGWGFVALFSWADRYLPASGTNYDQYGSFSYYGLRLLEQLVVFSPPAFLFVSGVFVAFVTGRERATVDWKVMGIRIRDLLIPYLLWSAALFVMFFVEGKTYSPSKYLWLLMTGSTNPAYYYVPLLIQFYLLSPLLVPLAKRRPLTLVIVAGITQVGVQLLYYPLFFAVDLPALQPYVDVVPKWFFPARILWFTLGVVAGFNLRSLEHALARIRWGLLATVLILFPLALVEWEVLQRVSGQAWLEHRETLLDTLYSACMIFCFLSFPKVPIPFTRALEEIGSRSFGVYIVHSPVMEVAARLSYHVVPWLLAYQILFQPLIIILGLGVPLLLMIVVQRSAFRGYYKYGFG